MDYQRDRKRRRLTLREAHKHKNAKRVKDLPSDLLDKKIFVRSRSKRFEYLPEFQHLEKEEEIRRSVGPVWAGNSCALDCVIFLAFQLNLSLTHCGIMADEDFGALNTCQRILMDLVRQPARDLETHKANITKGRDTIRSQLEMDKPQFASLVDEKKPELGYKHVAVNRLFEYLFTGFPEVTYQRAMCYRCLDCKEQWLTSWEETCTVTPHKIGEKSPGMTWEALKKESLEQILSYVSHPVHMKSIVCQKCKNIGHVWSRRALIGGLPSFLVGVDVVESPADLLWSQRDKLHGFRYTECVGAIQDVGRTALLKMRAMVSCFNKHFTARTERDGNWSLYNGMEGDGETQASMRSPNGIGAVVIFQVVSNEDNMTIKTAAQRFKKD